jgi:hypothetical protein
VIIVKTMLGHFGLLPLSESISVVIVGLLAADC